MPAVLATFSDELLHRIKALDSDFKEGDLTQKGYCKKKWQILKPLVDQRVVSTVEKLQQRLEATDIEECEYFNKMIEILSDASKYLPFLNGDNTGGNGYIRGKNYSKNKDPSFNSVKRPLESIQKVDIVKKVESEVVVEKNVRKKDNNSTMKPLNNLSSSSNSTKNEDSNKRKTFIAEDDCKINGDLVKKLRVEENETVKNNDFHSSNKIMEEELVNDSTLNQMNNKKQSKKCEICKQFLNSPELRLYPGHPEGATEEFVTLTDPKLSLFTGDEVLMDEDDSRPLVKVTQFSVYDKNGHLCPIDSGLIENNSLLYLSGYAKPIYDEDRSIEGGLPTRDIGPINEWWMSGYDGGDHCLVGFSTAYAEYYMLAPSPQYEPLLASVYEKVFLGKIVIEFLLEDENPSLEDLINRVQSAIPPAGVARCTEDSLFRHAQFVCNQVLNFETSFDYLETSLITKSCMRSLISLAGVTFGERQTIPRSNKVISKIPKSSWSKATTTPLVKDVFENFFKEHLDENGESEKASIKRTCGVCDQCRSSDCGTCTVCKKRAEGGFSQVNLLCRRRKCPNVALQEAEESEPDEDDDSSYVRTIDGTCAVASRQSRAGGGGKQVQWESDPLAHDPRRTFYSSAKVGDDTVKIGDCVSVEPSTSSSLPVIGRIMYMWENKQNQKFMHIHWFCRACETVLGETSNSRELFVVDDCENTLLSGIFNVVKVLKIPLSFQWAHQEVNISLNDNVNTFFYQKRYDEKHGRFEDLLPDPPCGDKEFEYRYCGACERNRVIERFETPTVEEKLQENESTLKVEYGVVLWRGEEYRPGDCVFLNPAAFRSRNCGSNHRETKTLSLDKVDEDIYPEYYRKLNSDSAQALSAIAPDPFCIGLLQSIFVKISHLSSPKKDIYLKVLKFYRPEDTQGIHEDISSIDINRLYASNEEVIVNFSEVAGKCVVVCSENIIGDPFVWSQEGPYRFYFSEAYDSEKHQLVDPSNGVRKLGDVGKGIGKSKSKSQKKKPIIGDWPAISAPLSCLDVFSGCGGLTEGLHQSGIVKTRWAIEKEESAANAFCLNNPRCTVFTEDCNLLLKMVMNGETRNQKGHKLPMKGQVDILCGGPPCQGFSGMNRFNSRQYSRFKNSLIVTYLSYCDYYRPRFFILENVRNFVSFKKGMVLKLTLHCLIKMGYQVTFGVLQAGNYGVPQTRRRAIILAAAPGEVLPQFPEPLHVFSPRATSLTVIIDDKKYVSNCRWTESAPFRMITVRDAMSDLPEIGNGSREEEVPYGVDPLSHFQKLMRGERYECTVRDHICKEMGPLVEARIGQIPAERGADWRDLPNIVLKLNDGTYTNKLVYSHHDRKNGDSRRGALRGVCACADGLQSCDPSDRQFNTLIPWCLPHTGNRHHHWAGLYGRLDWDGYFSTTITNPEPMGKQGRVLHPEQTRVVSVRECARSQGFPDYYRFFGSILDKHRQIGNAVPPPLGAALGREIRKSVAIKEKKSTAM